MNGCSCPTLKSHAINGVIEFNNGVVTKWLHYVDGSFTKKAAEVEAVRIVRAQHRGMGIAKCSVTSEK